MIKAEDLLRLDVELDKLIEGSEDWLERNDIDFGAIENIAYSAYVALIEKLEKGIPLDQAFSEVVANAFVLGWEAFRQYGERKA